LGLPEKSGQMLMPRTLGSPRHEVVRTFLVEQRRKSGLTQTQVARKLRRHQSFVATVESGQRRIDVVELLEFAEILGFDPGQLFKRMKAARA
jgi:transcriptional regulator with XRE-family HTH domain